MNQDNDSPAEPATDTVADDATPSPPTARPTLPRTSWPTRFASALASVQISIALLGSVVMGFTPTDEQPNAACPVATHLTSAERA